MEPWAHDPVLRLAAWLRSSRTGCTLLEGGLRLRVSAGVRPASPDRGCQVFERSHGRQTTVKPARGSGLPDSHATLVQLASVRTAANWSTIQFRSAASMTIGGASRTVDPWVSLARTPLANKRSHI